VNWMNWIFWLGTVALILIAVTGCDEAKIGEYRSEYSYRVASEQYLSIGRLGSNLPEVSLLKQRPYRRAPPPLALFSQPASGLRALAHSSGWGTSAVLPLSKGDAAPEMADDLAAALEGVHSVRHAWRSRRAS